MVIASFFTRSPCTIKWRGSSHKGKVAVSVTASHWCMQGELCGTHFTHKGGAANHLSRSRLSQLPIWSSREQLCAWIWLISKITETVLQCSLRSVLCFNKGGSHNDLNTVSIYMDPGVLWLPHAACVMGISQEQLIKFGEKTPGIKIQNFYIWIDSVFRSAINRVNAHAQR